MSSSKAVPNDSSTLTIVSTVFLFLTTVLFVTRVVWRLSQHQRGWDDLMASFAYITLVVQTSFCYVSAHHGFGKHRADLSIPAFQHAMKYFWFYQICYKLLGGFTKLNFCFLYLRIFNGSGMRGFQRIVWITAAVVAMGTLAFTVATATQCLPVRKNWNRRLEGRCVNYLAFWFSHAVFNTVMDIVVYVLPVPVIRTLQVARRTKTGLVLIFALGAFTIAASIVRMVMLPHSAKSTADPTWGSLQALVWTEVEANTAVICCCLPALRIVAVQLWKKLLGKTNAEASSTNPSSSEQGPSKSFPLVGQGLSKAFGTFATARYSPNTTSNEGDDITRAGQLRPPTPPAPSAQHARGSSSTSSSSSSSSSSSRPAAEGNSHQTTSISHSQPGPGIYKTTSVQMHTNRQSNYEVPKVKKDITQSGVAPGPAPSDASGGVEGKAKGLTLREMLDGRPPWSTPSQTRRL